ncbi:hypothetical protein NDA01_24195 [Trichocoleus desertorum AS-A10]|uniref:hypothetical protein n=1 Tax=Trichocoleus desertorum TaxID=1481672 RepID=UPI00329A18D1
MDKTFDASSVQATYESPAIDFSRVPKRSYDPSHSPATNESLDGCEQGFEESELPEPRSSKRDELLKIDHWKPTEPQFCKAIAEHYQQGKRTIQKWFVDLREIAPWLAESELRLSDDRYTPLAVELLGDRYFAGSKKKWAQVLTERFGDRAAANAPSPEAPAIRPEVLPREDQPAPVERTAASSLVPTGVNYLTALEEEEAELQVLEAQEVELLNRMHQSYTRLNQNQAQWDRTADLRRQRLLRQTRLEAAALATELEAEFENTLRETQYQIQRGNVPAPGKPQAQNPPSQSA